MNAGKGDGGCGWHALTAAEAVARLGSGVGGLSAGEAARRLAVHGPNRVVLVPRRPLWRVFLGQFQSPLIYILFAAALLAVALGRHDDSWVILVVVWINALIGTFQEGRAERSVEALKKLSELSATVVRDGQVRVVEAAGLVPGDVLVVSAGDEVAADARLCEACGLQVSEAALTGESVPVVKEVGVLADGTVLAERSNLVHAGTQVTAGRGRAVVVATGAESGIGRIAALTATARPPKTPLEVRMEQLSRYLVAVALWLFLMVVAAGYLRGMPMVDVLMVAMSQMVSLVPEGLPVALAIALAVGMQRMARHGAIVRTLSAVETLGCTTVICTDKTGTLTNNEMTVTAVWLPGDRRVDLEGAGYAPVGGVVGGACELAGDGGWERLVTAGVLCNDAQLVPPDAVDSRWRALGDPTEAALLTLAMKVGVDPARLRHEWVRHGEIPFDPAAKLMATAHRRADGEERVFLKGAPEWVLPLCGQVWRDNGAAELGGDKRATILARAGEMAAGALRLLGVAFIEGGGWDETAGFSALAGRAVFLGLVGQMDPPRGETRGAVAACRAAGIRTVMVTGDHRATGLAIARQLDIARAGDLAVDGGELEDMPEQDLEAGLERIAVFARVHPAQKLRIVEAFQAQGQVVAMTGDGVNDAPALARADVGVAMGITGTSVAKGASNMILTDDRFATLVDAVEQGRLIHGNIRKLLLFLFATSVDEVVILLGALAMGLPLPLAAVQILWINLVTEGTLTINLVMEGAEGDEMARRPVRRRDPLVSREMLWRMAVMIPASVVVTLGYFVWRLGSGASLALVQTETFTLLAVCQWFNAVNCESATRSALRLGVLRNRWLAGGLLIAVLLQLAVVYSGPLASLFHTVPIPVLNVCHIVLLASGVLWAEELRKGLARRRARQASGGEFDT